GVDSRRGTRRLRHTSFRNSFADACRGHEVEYVGWLQGISSRRWPGALVGAPPETSHASPAATGHLTRPMLQVQGGANTVCWWAAERILERRLPGAFPKMGLLATAQRASLARVVFG